MAMIDVINPAYGTLVGQVHNASISDCLAAVDAAHDAFPGWKATAPRQRGEILRKAFELMMASQEELARLITQENGKVLAAA